MRQELYVMQVSIGGMEPNTATGKMEQKLREVLPLRPEMKVVPGTLAMLQVLPSSPLDRGTKIIIAVVVETEENTDTIAGVF